MDLFDIYFTMATGDIHGLRENRIRGVLSNISVEFGSWHFKNQI